MIATPRALRVLWKVAEAGGGEGSGRWDIDLAALELEDDLVMLSRRDAKKDQILFRLTPLARRSLMVLTMS